MVALIAVLLDTELLSFVVSSPLHAHSAIRFISIALLSTLSGNTALCLVSMYNPNPIAMMRRNRIEQKTIKPKMKL